MGTYHSPRPIVTPTPPNSANLTSRRTWRPGEPLAGVAPNAQRALEADAAQWHRCQACNSRDRLNRSLAVELDRVLAENARLRAGQEAA